MSMRITSSRRAGALFALLLVAAPVTTLAAKSRKGADTADADDTGDADDPEKKLPPILLEALHEKEAEVTAARREAIKLIESYLHDSPHSREQAEAMYKLAELYWEESKAVYLEKMGRYQEAVTACHADRAECPKVPHRPPTVDLAQAQAVYLQLIKGYPKFRKIDTVIYLYAFSLRDQGKMGEAVKYFQIILDKYPRSRYVADAWMAIGEYRFYEQQNYKSSLEAYEKVIAHPKSQLYDLALFKTAWCYWKLGDTDQVAPSASRTCSTSPRRRRGAPRRSRSARRSCRGRRSTTWSSCSPRTTPRAPTTRSSSWPRSAASSTRARC